MKVGSAVCKQSYRISTLSTFSLLITLSYVKFGPDNFHEENCPTFAFKKKLVTDGRTIRRTDHLTDRRTQPHIEMRGRIEKSEQRPYLIWKSAFELSQDSTRTTPYSSGCGWNSDVIFLALYSS